MFLKKNMQNHKVINNDWTSDEYKRYDVTVKLKIMTCNRII